MKRYCPFPVLALILGMLGSRAASASDVQIVANPGLAANSISAADLKNVFLMTKSAVNGESVQPVLQKNGSAHEAFIKGTVGKSDSALQAYYRSLLFSGQGSMPKSFSSDAEVVAYVAKTKGAIGYVSASAAPKGVKTIEVK
jgi:hypothetical protein